MRHMADERDTSPEISRRRALHRGAIIGAGVWVVPTISSFRVPARGQVGSPAPEPSPTPTTLEPTPTETTTPLPSPSPTTTVGGVKVVTPTDVGGAGLAETGQDLTTHAAAGAGLAVLGTALRGIAGKRLPKQPPQIDPPEAS